MHLLAQLGDVGRQLRGKRLAPGLERFQGRGLRSDEPPATVLGDPAFFDQLRVAPPLCRRDRLGAGHVHDGRQVEREDEQRAPHPDHAHERSVFVQRPIELGAAPTASQSRSRSEVHGRRVGGVEAGQAGRQLDRVGRPGSWREELASRQPSAPLFDGEPPALQRDSSSASSFGSVIGQMWPSLASTSR